jgi:hypothetical protein
VNQPGRGAVPVKHSQAQSHTPNPASGIAFPSGDCYSEDMTTREKVIQVMHDLPEDASVEDAMERILFLAKIERGLEQADAGQTIAHAQVKEQMTKWLK